MEWTSVSLRVFRSVAERGSFSAAAASLGYTQSAVSRQIASLERAAGGLLFLRSADGTRLTDAGRVLLAHATQALDVVDQGYDTLHDRAENRSRLRVGAFTTTAMVLLPSTITALQRLHPGLVVESREGSTISLLRSLRAGTLDAAIIGQQPPFALPADGGLPIAMTPLIQGELVVALPENSAVGTSGEATLAELSTLTWISGPADETDSAPGPLFHSDRGWFTRLGTG
jgi:DNA-binding transcriptional LysR family regulator